jgi:hypothetical protein
MTITNTTFRVSTPSVLAIFQTFTKPFEMKNNIFTLLFFFTICTLPADIWGQCPGVCPNNDNSCNNNPMCCIASGGMTSTIDNCINTPGVTVVRVKYNATISNGIDATNTRFCLVSNNNIMIANNVLVDNTTCFQTNGNGNNNIIINVGGTPVSFNAGPGLDILNDALASLTTSTLIQDVVIALPVQLLSYTVKQAPQGMLLEWATATENNNDHFLLERSVDGKIFESLASIPAQGDGLQQQQYQYLDKSARPGINYYRLWQYDFDGTKSNLGIVQAQSTTKQVFTFAPNPVASGARISLFSSLEEVDLPTTSFQLVNTLGQVWSLTLDQGSLIIPSGLSQGLYYLSVIQPSGREVSPITIIN